MTTENAGQNEEGRRRKRKKKKSQAAIDRIFASYQPLPWERQRDEPIKSFEAFRVYMEMGQGRSLAKLTAKLDPEFKEKYGVEIKPRYLKYCQFYKWNERARAWDAQIDRELMIEEIESRKKMIDRHIITAEKMWEKAFIALNNIDPNRLTNPESIVKFLEASVKMERVARGIAETIEKKEIEITSFEEQNVTVQVEPEKLNTVLEILENIGVIPGMQPPQVIDVEHRSLEHHSESNGSEDPNHP